MGVATFTSNLAFASSIFFLASYSADVTLNSQGRLIVWAAMFLPVFVIGLVTIWKFPRKYHPLPFPLGVHHRNDWRHVFHCSSFCTAFIYAFSAVWLYAFWFSESNPGNLLRQSPCGASSCTSQQFVNKTYNAVSFYTGLGLTYEDFRPTICGYDTDACRWGGSNGEPIWGYPARPGSGCADTSQPREAFAGLITSRPQDWPNKAYGCFNGFYDCYNSSKASDAAPCPGTFMNITSGRLEGKAPCFYCYPYWNAHLSYANPAQAYCPTSFAPLQSSYLTPLPASFAAENDGVWCGDSLFSLCLPPEAGRTPYDCAMIFKYSLLIVTVFPACWIICEATQAALADVRLMKIRRRLEEKKRLEPELEKPLVREDPLDDLIRDDV